jgi:hypothetical protein
MKQQNGIDWGGPTVERKRREIEVAFTVALRVNPRRRGTSSSIQH